MLHLLPCSQTISLIWNCSEVLVFHDFVNLKFFIIIILGFFEESMTVLSLNDPQFGFV